MKTLRSVLAFAVVSLAVGLSFARQDSSQRTPQEPAGNPALHASGTVVALGDPIEWANPKYPRHALKERIQGSVVLRVTVSKDGRVKSVSAEDGDPELAEAAIHAVHKWRYVPHFQNGHPVEAQTKIIINFKITDKGRRDISAKYDLPNETPMGVVFKVGEWRNCPTVDL